MNTESAAPATRSTVSETNRSRVLHYLYTHGISSRASIAQALGLSAAAITKITARLIDAGIIHEVGGIEGRKNRRSIGLELDPRQFHFIGVKFARSLVEIGVFDLKGETSSLTDLPPVQNDTIPDTIRSIHKTINTLLGNDSSIVAIGMAVPGPYLRHEGRTAVVSSMQGWRTFNFLDEFSDAFRVPVFVEQDARAGVLAQYLLDPTSSTCRNLAYYLLGEGVGLGVIDDGRARQHRRQWTAMRLRQPRMPRALLLGRSHPPPAQRNRHRRRQRYHDAQASLPRAVRAGRPRRSRGTASRP